MILRPSDRHAGSLARPRARVEREEDGDAWLVSYADMVTLLLAFFVAIVAVVGHDEPTLENLVAGFVAVTGGGDEEIGQEARGLAAEVRSAVAELPYGDNASIIEGEGSIAIELPGEVLFERATAELDPAAVALVRGIADVLRGPDWRRWAVEVEGHTDDAPATSARFPSPWELAAARATAVVRLLEAFGVAPARLQAVAYGAARPKKPNHDASGTPFPANQAANNRIVILATR